MNDFTWLAHFAWDHAAWIFWPLMALFFALMFLFDRLRAERWMPAELWAILLIQALFLPFFAFLTIYCYQYPERIVTGDPLSDYFNDMRDVWKQAAFLDACAIAYFAYLAWCSSRLKRFWAALARSLLDDGDRLTAAGKADEANAAYRKYQWILNTKLGGKRCS